MSKQTYLYRKGYIHLSYDPDTKKETVCVQILDDKTLDYYTKYVKSFRAAQIFITKFLKINKKD